MNWNDVVRAQLYGETRSRGQIIPVLGSASGMVELQAGLNRLVLEGIPPFRLVGVVPAEKAIGVWRWDSVQLTFQGQAWHTGHWFSSSLSDSDAESVRGIACRDAQHEPDAGSAPWMRRLHASHTSGPGPFSLCVHREDVKTLSYTEVMVTRKIVQMGHFRGSPCTMGQIHPIAVERVDCTSLSSRDIGPTAS